MFGKVDTNGVCTSANQICSNGLACNSPCCEIFAENPKGVCPGAGQYCVGNQIVTGGGVCTVDENCTTQGPGAVCAGLDYTETENGPVPVPDSGACCPSGYYFDVPDSGHPVGFARICCSSGTIPSSAEPTCCRYPAQNAVCTGCDCSVGTIRRCCRTDDASKETAGNRLYAGWFPARDSVHAVQFAVE